MTEAELRRTYQKRRESRREKLAVVPELLQPEALPLTREQKAEADACTEIGGIREAKMVAMRMLGFEIAEIAEALNAEPKEVKRWLLLARRRGSLNDIGDRLQHLAAAAAVDKLVEMIEAGNPDAVLETLKGLGYFRNHTQVKQEGTPGDSINLMVKVELPAGVSSPADIPILGQISGVPRELSDGKDDGDEGR